MLPWYRHAGCQQSPGCHCGDRGVTSTKVMRDFVDKPRLSKSTSVSAPALVVPTPHPLAKDVGTAVVKARLVPSPKVQANRQQRVVRPAIKPCVGACKRLATILLCVTASCLPRSRWPGLLKGLGPSPRLERSHALGMGSYSGWMLLGTELSCRLACVCARVQARLVCI